MGPWTCFYTISRDTNRFGDDGNTSQKVQRGAHGVTGFRGPDRDKNAASELDDHEDEVPEGDAEVVIITVKGGWEVMLSCSGL